MPRHDIEFTYDNQKVGYGRLLQSGRIQEGATVPLSICTYVAYIQNNPPTQIQKNGLLKPSQWLNKLSNATIIEKVDQLECSSLDVLRKSRNDYVNDVITRVDCELHKQGEHIVDYIDVASVQTNMGKANCVCCKCSFVYVKLENIYPQCQGT